MKNPFPPAVRTIGVAAPASSADRAKYDASVKLLESFGLRVIPAKHLFSDSPRAQYLSATDDERANDLNELIRNPEINLIQCLRGGYGSPRILHKIDWETLQKRNLPIIGFSDITAIHLAMLAKNAGIPIAGQMTARFAEAMEDSFTADSFARALNTAFSIKNDSTEKIELDVLKQGNCRGTLITANLSLLTALCGTPFLPDFSGKILILEDIGEPVRKLDRHFTQLLHCGIPGKLAGLIFAQFTDCGEAEERENLFRDFAESVRGPVLTGLSFGHELPSRSFVCGTEARIENECFTLI